MKTSIVFTMIPSSIVNPANSECIESRSLMSDDESAGPGGNAFPEAGSYSEFYAGDAGELELCYRAFMG